MSPPRFFAPLTITTQTGVAYSVSDINSAYNVAPLSSDGINGAGQTIALIEFDYFTTADLHVFDVANHLPDPSISYHYAGGKKFSVPPRRAIDHGCGVGACHGPERRNSGLLPEEPVG